MPNPRLLFGFLLGLGSAGCDPDRDRAAERDSSILADRDSRFAAALRAPDSARAKAPLARWDLPQGLREVSGLALTPDDRLFAHDDNTAVIYQIDYRRGAIVKEFVLGEKPVQGDFESIAVAGDRLYLLTSDGILYRFPEGADRGRVAFSEIDTGLGKHCELEGMTYEAGSNSLLLACKTVYQKSLERAVVLYRWPLPEGEPLTRIVVTEPQLARGNDRKALHPTDLAIDPRTGNYVLLTKEQVLLELTPGGAVASLRKLPAEFHQPEGLAITRDGFLLISDEAGHRPASVTAYRRLPGGEGAGGNGGAGGDGGAP